VHLERVLPIEVSPDLPAQPAASDRSSVRTAAEPTIANLRQVVPPPAAGDGEEVVPTPLTGSLAFEPADPKNLDLLWPVETRTVSSAWGPRMRSRTVKVKAHKRKVHYRGSHKGVDLSAPKGADVFAALDGQVVACGRHRQYGNFVVLDHGNGVITLYAHHNRNFVKEGEIVRRGQKIAEVGRTGNATGPHLHFELRLEGLPQNPLPFMNDVEEIPADVVAQNQTAVAPTATR
jgi:murein DD-endopeptidase MepM/ murein hydrolase activator NlpD